MISMLDADNKPALETFAFRKRFKRLVVFSNVLMDNPALVGRKGGKARLSLLGNNPLGNVVCDGGETLFLRITVVVYIQKYVDFFTEALKQHG